MENKFIKISKNLLFLLLVLFFVCLGYFLFFRNTQKIGLTAISKINPVEISSYLNSLNKERFTEESKQYVRDFIKSEFEKYGYNATEQKTDNGYTNIIASKSVITNKDILIGAHYDTVPDTVGIDDNASGVSALLAIAKYNQNFNVRFVVFDGEEYGFSGSSYYVKNTYPNPRLVIILETIGYYSDNPNTQKLPKFYDILYRGLYNRLKENEFRGNFSTSVCTNNAKLFCDNYESYGSSLNLEVNTLYIPKISFIKNLFLDLFRSDHAPFLIEGIPAVMITDSGNFRNPNYHESTDTIDTISADFIAKQANAILAAISGE
ncbi:MAG: M28 family peptidase [bacterium]|nr:M28 family peptidase [bacterium]